VVVVVAAENAQADAVGGEQSSWFLAAVCAVCIAATLKNNFDF
jgi:hypothetical protein